MAPGDWLLLERNDTGRIAPRVVSDEIFQTMVT
jgi:hypothetical protein